VHLLNSVSTAGLGILSLIGISFLAVQCKTATLEFCIHSKAQHSPAVTVSFIQTMLTELHKTVELFDFVFSAELYIGKLSRVIFRHCWPILDRIIKAVQLDISLY